MKYLRSRAYFTQAYGKTPIFYCQVYSKNRCEPCSSIPGGLRRKLARWKKEGVSHEQISQYLAAYAAIYNASKPNAY